MMKHFLGAYVTRSLTTCAALSLLGSSAQAEMPPRARAALARSGIVASQVLDALETTEFVTVLIAFDVPEARIDKLSVDDPASTHIDLAIRTSAVAAR